MTFGISFKRILLLSSLFIFMVQVSCSKVKLLKNSATIQASTKDFDKEKLKKYYELGLNLPLKEDDQIKCWDFTWEKGGWPKLITAFQTFWQTQIEPFIKTPTAGLDLNKHLGDLINNILGSSVQVEEGKNAMNCSQALNKALKTEIKLDIVKKEAMNLFGIVEPAKPKPSAGFITSSVTTFRNEKFVNPGIFKLLNGKRPS